jgi:hypothetical protein
MGLYSHIWSIAKKNVMAVILGITISDRCVAFVSVTGESMHPTFTATNDVLRGIVISFCTYQAGMDSWVILPYSSSVSSPLC